VFVSLESVIDMEGATCKEIEKNRMLFKKAARRSKKKDSSKLASSFYSFHLNNYAYFFSGE
jgi:hypothetical protein